jgi:hypothetical protein
MIPNELYPVIRNTVLVMMNSTGTWFDQREWGCGLKPGFIPYKLHRGRKGSIVIYEPKNSIGSIHTHPTRVAIPSPTSVQDVFCHCYGAFSQGTEDYYSVAATYDAKCRDIIAWGMNGIPGTPHFKEIIEGYPDIEKAARKCRISSIAYSQYIYGIRKLCSELGIVFEEFHINMEEG